MRAHVTLLGVIGLAAARKHVFNVNEDILAFPQYEIDISNDPISRHDAEKISASGDAGYAMEKAPGQPPYVDTTNPSSTNLDITFTYETLKRDDKAFLCKIPVIPTASPEDNDTAEASLSAADLEKDLALASTRAWQVLSSDVPDRPGGQQCIYYWNGGWWAYQYCFDTGVRQFHQMATVPGHQGMVLGTNGRPIEDPNVPGFMLGETSNGKTNQEQDGAVRTDIAVAQKNAGEARYLVQNLGGGTKCDMTGQARRVEVQFHCNPSAREHISLIKETASCVYLMIIQTPRLCNDVTFQPPRRDAPHQISCSPILADGEAEAGDLVQGQSDVKDNRLQQEAQRQPPLPTVGNIVVGAHKWIPQGRNIEKSGIVGGKRKETIVEVLADSTGHQVSIDRMNQLGLKNAKTVEQLKEQLRKNAKGESWRLEVIDTAKGREYRGIIGDDEAEGQVDGQEGGQKDKGSSALQEWLADEENKAKAQEMIAEFQKKQQQIGDSQRGDNQQSHPAISEEGERGSVEEMFPVSNQAQEENVNVIRDDDDVVEDQEAGQQIESEHASESGAQPVNQAGAQDQEIMTDYSSEAIVQHDEV